MSESSEGVTPPYQTSAKADKKQETNSEPRVLEGMPKIVETPQSVQAEIDKAKFTQERLLRINEAKRRIKTLKRGQLENSG